MSGGNMERVLRLMSDKKASIVPGAVVVAMVVPSWSYN